MPKSLTILKYYPWPGRARDTCKILAILKFVLTNMIFTAIKLFKDFFSRIPHSTLGEPLIEARTIPGCLTISMTIAKLLSVFISQAK